MTDPFAPRHARHAIRETGPGRRERRRRRAWHITHRAAGVGGFVVSFVLVLSLGSGNATWTELAMGTLAILLFALAIVAVEQEEAP